MVVILKCAPWRGLMVSVSPLAHQSLHAATGFEKIAFGSGAIF
jgi:hypothetical protein